MVLQIPKPSEKSSLTIEYPILEEDERVVLRLAAPHPLDLVAVGCDHVHQGQQRHEQLDHVDELLFLGFSCLQTNTSSNKSAQAYNNHYK